MALQRNTISKPKQNKKKEGRKKREGKGREGKERKGREERGREGGREGEGLPKSRRSYSSS